MVSLSPLCVFEEQARMKCKTGQRSSTQRIMVIAKPCYQGPSVVCASVNANLLMCVMSVYVYVKGRESGCDHVLVHFCLCLAVSVVCKSFLARIHVCVFVCVCMHAIKD